MSSTFDKIRQSSGLELIGNYGRIARCIDMHTGGEPLRVVMQGVPKITANSILDYRKQMKENHDYFRKQLMWEPRGHADMYGAILLPPERSDSDFGMLFMHNEGYSTMCGHATIAIAKLAVLMGWVQKREPVIQMKIDAPCGQLEAFVEIKNGKIKQVYFDNVPSFMQHANAEIEIEGGQKIKYDLAFGGAFYAYVNADQLGLNLIPKNYSEIIKIGKLIKQAVSCSQEMRHPFEPDLNFLYGTIFIEESKESGVHSKNVCMFADGEIDRSATGSGVSGRAAIHYFKNELNKKETITIRSIVDSDMKVSVQEELDFGPYKAVIPRVYGDAWITGFNELVLDREDIFKEGFFLR